MSDFTPVLYLKRSCPFCLKVAAYLSEVGVFDALDVRAFWPGEESEAVIRRELEGKIDKVTFPTLQYEPARYMTESDAIIARYARSSGIDPGSLPFYNYVIAGPVRQIREQFLKIRDLEQERQTENS